MDWSVFFKKQAQKQLRKLPSRVVKTVRFLVRELEMLGPIRHNWKNFGKLEGRTNFYHCHVKKGKPTYVVCWEVKDKKIQIIEVHYVGTHEKAKY